MYQQLIEDFIQQERLPPSYLMDASQCFLPVLHDIESRLQQNRQGPLIVGINGAQGTGKSTLAKLLSSLLSQSGYTVANLSIDDFYYSKAKRKELAANVHPLLLSRGVPGTHDIELALQIFSQLEEATASEEVRLPGFDKSTDDCLPTKDCELVRGPVDVIILEGWFVGVSAQAEEELKEPINDLETKEDGDGDWRNYVNQRLADSYQTLFSKLQMLLMLRAPGFEQVLEWRSLQEEKLRANSSKNASGLMSPRDIERFIQHFERLTRHCLQTLPQSAQVVFHLDADHRIQLNAN